MNNAYKGPRTDWPLVIGVTTAILCVLYLFGVINRTYDLGSASVRLRSFG